VDAGSSEPAKEATMAEAMETILRRWTEEIWSQGNMATVDEIVAADIVNYNPDNSEIRGIEGFKEFLSAFRAACPDARFTVEDTVAAGDRAVLRWILRTTHRGEWLGVPGTGKFVTLNGMTMLRLAGAKVTEHRYQYDHASWLKQLGVTEVLGEAKAAGI
jgi:steroid delta-isomerase-like uncharacterized protein